MRRTMPFRVMLLTVAFLLAFLSVPTCVYASYGRSTASIVANYDGYIMDTFATFAGNNDNLAGNNGVNVYRAWFSFDLSGIPDTAIIANVSLLYAGKIQVSDCELIEMARNASTIAGASLYGFIGNGTVIYNTAGFPVLGQNQAAELGVNRDAYCKSFETILSSGQDWYSVGFTKINEGAADGVPNSIDNTEDAGATPKPTLYIEYYVDPYVYGFTDTYYENGTVYHPSVEVNVAADGYSDTFNVSGGTTQYYNTSPEAFYWDLGGGYARYIYTYESENFTITMPESTFYVYQFTIKDHTGKTGLGDCYLEAYRTINGTETLIERMKIYLGNPVPLNLVYGRTYHLRVLFADGSRYDWGYFMAGGTDSINLILKGVTFTDQAQILYNHIHVEATRTATVVTVNYLDDRDNTVWANTTIRIRNGAVVLFAARTNSSYTINWGGADAATGYTVTVAGEHTDYGVWGRSFILDPDETFPDPPSLAGIYGGVDSNFIAWVITMISLLTFSVAFRARGLVATMFIASILNYLGWASWGYDWLAFGWLIAVGVALTAGGKS